MTVIKRDGRKVEFDKQKIFNAIEKAYNEVYEEIWGAATEHSLDELNSIVEEVCEDCLYCNGGEEIPIETIQDFVEHNLMDFDKAVAKAYITYRYRRALARDEYKALMTDVKEKVSAENVQNQNANVDEHSFGGRVGETADLIMKRYALDYVVSPMAKENHLNNEIYIHDLSAYAVGSHNCLSVPFDDLLANGFNTRQTDVRPAQSVSTAFQLVAVIFQLQSLQQFGGVSATHLDWTMIPYVRKSFYKHYKDGLDYVDNIEFEELEDSGIDINGIDVENTCIEDEIYRIFPKSYNYAMDMTVKEVYQAVEGMYHNLKIWAQ